MSDLNLEMYSNIESDDPSINGGRRHRRRRRRSTRKGQVRKTARRAYMKVGRKTRKSGGKKRRGRKSKRC